MEQFICKYCGKICKNKNSLVQHEIRCKENPNKIDITNSINNINVYNASEHKGSNQYIRAKKLGLQKPIISDETRLKLSKGMKNKHHSSETKEKLSKVMRDIAKKQS